MATLYIAEYPTIGNFFGASGAAVTEPPLAEQTLGIGAGSVASAAFSLQTKIIRLHCDTVCSVAFGLSPAATTSNKRMAANQTEFFCVPQGQSYKVAVIANT